MTQRLTVVLALLTLFIVAATSSAVAVPERAADRVQYRVILDEPQTQMVTIELRIPAVTGDAIDFHLPVWRPGKYLVIDPAGTVRDVTARTASGEQLKIEKIRKSAWRIAPNPNVPVTVRYRVYANSLGDRTRHVDDTHAFLSGSSVFLFAEALRDAPLEVEIVAPQGWKIASGLEFAHGSDDTLTAPNYDVLVDSPIEIGEHEFIRFEALGKPHDIVIWGDVKFDAEQLVEDFRDIVETQHAIFGDLPYERYVFLIHAGQGAGGGTEHLNSTIMQTSASALEGSIDNNSSYHRFLGLVSHEFFHTWNVKQLRPAGLLPYDYERENYTKLLWVAEGTTSYYDDLTLVRTGVYSADRYIDILGGAINGLQGRPGRLVQSLEESSFDAWIKFNRSTPDDANSQISFYSKGALVSLLLDMELRGATNNEVPLDTVMKAMYQRFPLSGSGFTPEDLVAVIEELSGTDFDPFFAAYVRGTAELDYAKALAVVGLEPHFRANSRRNRNNEGDSESKENVIPQRPTLGVSLSGTTVRGVASDGPAYAAGIMPGDEFIALNGKRISSSGSINDLIADLKPGDEVNLLFFRRDDLREMTLALGAEPDGRWIVRRLNEPTVEQKTAYYTWIGHPWPGEKPPGEEGAEEEANPDRAEGG